MVQPANRLRCAVQWKTFARSWLLLDADRQCPIVCSDLIAKHLLGKHKVIWHPQVDCGDHVVVFNTQKIAMEDEKWRTFKFYWNTGFPRGLRTTRAYQMHQYDPTMVLKKMVYNTLPGHIRRKSRMALLHLFHDENIPPHILRNVTDQIRQPMHIPKRLDQYTNDEIAAFPKLFDFPTGYVMQGNPRRII